MSTPATALHAELDRVTFTHHAAEAPALADVSIEFEPGTVTLLCGASGSGKSTVLRLLNGLAPHVDRGQLTGTIRVGDVVTTEAPLWRVGALSGTVFQNPRTQFFAADVRSELGFASENGGIDPDVIKERVEAAARATHVQHLLDCSLHRLSSGQLHRVACAAAIAARPGMYLFDEPTSNLSPTAIDELRDILAMLRAKGATIVVAEHRLYFLAGLVDQVIVLRQGRIAQRYSGDAFFALTDRERLTLGLRTLRKPNGRLVRRTSATQISGLAVTGLRFGYGPRIVLDLSRLDFPAGTVTALVGENGAGKTTLTRILCGLLDANKGCRITLDGVAVNARARLRSAAMVMQDPHRQLFGESVTAEVTLGLPATTKTLDVQALLADMDLADVADRHPLALSGGQQQRLVIAAAIARQARLYVFDEPTSGVDNTHLLAIATRLRQLAAGGAVVVVVTHDREFLTGVADRMIEIPRLAEQARRPLTASPLSRGE